ncbi:MAG: hypothetical protein ACYCYF_04545 [Anaerolineae bacterium]
MSALFVAGSLAQTIGLWVAALLTLAVLSYVLGDGPVFRFTQYLFVGIAAGYASALAWRLVLAPRLALLAREPAAAWPYAIMFALGLLLLARGWPPLSRLAGLPLALLLGVGAAVAVGGVLRGTLVPLMASSIVSLAPVDYAGGLRGWAYALDAAFMLLTTVAVVAAYRFRAAGDGSGNLWAKMEHGLGKLGRTMILLVLAALLAGAALSFFSALRGQVDVLIYDWLGSLFGWGG